MQYVDRNVGPADYAKLQPDQLLVTKVFYTIQSEGPLVGTPSVFIRLAGCNKGDKVSCPNCFPDFYPVNTNKGKKLLGDIKVGDKVLTLDDDFGLAFTEVTNVLSRRASLDEMVKITYSLEGSTSKMENAIHCTKEHPFYVKDKGFVAAGELQPDDIVYHVKMNEVLSFLKRHNNPMWNEQVAKKAGATLVRRYELGEIKPPVMSDEGRQSLSKRMKENNPSYNKASYKKSIEWKQLNQYKESIKEKKFRRWCEEVGFHNVRWVGNDTNYLIGDDTDGYIIPDFVIEGTNKLIEVYDRSNSNGYVQDRNSPEGEAAYVTKRRTHYGKFGYDCLVISYQDCYLGNGSGNQLSLGPLKRTLGKYTHNGAIIKSVSKPARNFRPCNVINLTCAPHSTFLMQGLLTHNCDTNFLYDNGTIHTVADLINSVKIHFNTSFRLGLAASPPLVVLSGGEPLIQDNIVRLIEACHSASYRVQIESNGDRLPVDFTESDGCHRAILVVSPKVNPASKHYQRLSDAVFKRADYLKFVVASDPLSPYATLPEYIYEWCMARNTSDRIFISPWTVYQRAVAPDEIASIWTDGLIDRKQTQANLKYAVDLCLKYGYRLNTQVHLIAGIE